MNYLLKNNSQKTVNEHLVYGVLLCVFLIILRICFALFFSSLITTVSKPFWSLRDNWFGPHTTIEEYIETKKMLLGTIEALRSDNYALTIKNMELSSGIEAMRKQLNEDAIQKANTRLTSKVISKPPYSPFDTFILDTGTEKGVTVNSPVYVGENVYIGTISRVGHAFAEVTLFSSGSSIFESRVLRTGEIIQLRGQGGGSFSTIVPKDFDIQENDVLVAGSRTQSIVAIVQNIDSSSQGSFKTLYARLPANIFKTEWVGIDQK